MNITKKDIIGFGKVVEVIGKVIQNDPKLLLDYVSKLEQEDGKNKPKEEIDNEKLENIDLFKLSNQLDKQGLFDFMLEFKVSELKYLLKRYHFGGSKIKSKDKIINHIIDNLSKRSSDVFKNYETINNTSNLTIDKKST